MKSSLTNFLKVAEEKHKINFRWPNNAQKIFLRLAGIQCVKLLKEKKIHWNFETIPRVLGRKIYS